MEEGGGMWKRRRAKLRPREGGEGEGGDVAVIMAMGEGKDDGGGGSALDVGLEFEPSRASSARLARARFVNELARLDSLL